MRLERETVWLTQKQMAALFDTSTDNVGLHLKKIFSEGELAEAATAEDYSVVRIEGRRRVRRQVKHYNLDAIISVGYRVNIKRGTQFRIWATRTLREHLLRGYMLNQQRLAEAWARSSSRSRSRRGHSPAMRWSPGGAGGPPGRPAVHPAWRLLLEYDEKRLPERSRQPVAPSAR